MRKLLSVLAGLLLSTAAFGAGEIFSPLTFSLSPADGTRTGTISQTDYNAFFAASSPALSVGTFVTSGTAKGLDLTSNVLSLHAATLTSPGAVSTGTQVFGGQKTFGTLLSTTFQASTTIVAGTSITAGTQFIGPGTGITGIPLTSGVTGVLPLANGGTNNSSAFPAKDIVFSNGSSLITDSSLQWDTSTARFGVNLGGATIDNTLQVRTSSTTDSLAQAMFNTGAATNKGLVIQGFSAQTANLQEWQSSAGALLSGVGPTGAKILTRTSSASSGTINNLAVTTGHLAFTSSSATVLTGVVAQTSGARVLIHNAPSSGVSTAILTIKNESTSSTAANRFSPPGGVDYVLQPNDSVWAEYSGTTSRWLIDPIGASASASQNGIVNQAVQSFTGQKTFASGIKTPTVSDSAGNILLDAASYSLGAGLPSNTMIDMAQYVINANSNVKAIDVGNFALYHGSTKKFDWNTGIYTRADSSTAANFETGGGLYDNSSGNSLDFGNRYLYSASNLVANWGTSELLVGGMSPSLNWASRILINSGNTSVLNYETLITNDSAGLESIDWGGRYLVGIDGSVHAQWDAGILYYATVEKLNWQADTLRDNFGTLALDWGNRTLNDSSGSSVITWSGSGGLGFFSASPVTIQTGSSGGYNIGSTGSTGPAQYDTQYTGGIGGTGYTTDDLVRALKNFGLIQQ